MYAVKDILCCFLGVHAKKMKILCRVVLIVRNKICVSLTLLHSYQRLTFQSRNIAGSERGFLSDTGRAFSGQSYHGQESTGAFHLGQL